MLQQQNKPVLVFMSALICLAMNLKSEAIINIEDQRKEGEIGLFNSISASLDASRGNRDRDNYSLSYRLDNNTETIDSFIIYSQSERKYEGTVKDESNFFHARLVLKNSSDLHYEVFAQVSENPFRNYKNREVIGGGLRWLLNDHARLGISLIQEDEEGLDGTQTKTDRMNIYFHDDYEIDENITFNTTLYFQPSLDEYEDDYKASIIFAFDFLINQNLEITLQYSRFNDSMPPVNSDKMDEGISTKFTYNF